MSGPAPLCCLCGQVIGVYEPLIALCDGKALESSRAATRDGEPRGALYHRACYPLRGDRRQ